MDTENQIAGALEDTGAALRQTPSARDAVMRRVRQETIQRPSSGSRRRLIGRLIALAACAAIALLVWSPWGNGVGASEAFAAAIANVQQARTFACRQISTRIVDGEEQSTEMSYAFQEPNLERIEYGQGMPSPGEFMVTDYGKQLRLVARPEEQSASLEDIRTMYAVDEQTGQLKPSELGTQVRDDVLRLSAQAVRDLGKTTLEGREVWVLQSDDAAEPVKTVYVNPVDGKPVQIEIAWPSEKRSFTYADIELDLPLDPGLFSLEAPQGYAMHGGSSEPVAPVDEINGKMMSKAKELAMQCFLYASQHDDRWPESFDDLRAAGLDARKLQTLLAAPDSKDGKPVLLYRKPVGAGSEPQVVIYEAPEFRRKSGVVCAFNDGHAELVPHAQFAKLVK